MLLFFVLKIEEITAPLTISTQPTTSDSPIFFMGNETMASVKGKKTYTNIYRYYIHRTKHKVFCLYHTCSLVGCFFSAERKKRHMKQNGFPDDGAQYCCRIQWQLSKQFFLLKDELCASFDAFIFVIWTTHRVLVHLIWPEISMSMKE